LFSPRINRAGWSNRKAATSAHLTKRRGQQCQASEVLNPFVFFTSHMDMEPCVRLGLTRSRSSFAGTAPVKNEESESERRHKATAVRTARTHARRARTTVTGARDRQSRRARSTYTYQYIASRYFLLFFFLPFRMRRRAVNTYGTVHQRGTRVQCVLRAQ
jgi:hypothetical protein